MTDTFTVPLSVRVTAESREVGGTRLVWSTKDGSNA